MRVRDREQEHRAATEGTMMRLARAVALLLVLGGCRADALAPYIGHEVGVPSRAESEPASNAGPAVVIDDFPVYEAWIDQRSAHSHGERVSVDRLPIPGGVRLNIATGGMPITNMTIDLRRRDDGQVAVMATGKWCEDTRGHPREIDVPLDCRLIQLNTSYVGTANPLNIKFAARYSADGHVGVISGALSKSY